jgi:hypothetical protein
LRHPLNEILYDTSISDLLHGSREDLLSSLTSNLKDA